MSCLVMGSTVIVVPDEWHTTLSYTYILSYIFFMYLSHTITGIRIDPTTLFPWDRVIHSMDAFLPCIQCI